MVVFGYLVRTGPPVLNPRRARSARRFAAANAILVLLAGALAAHGTYDPAFGWLALGFYLGTDLAVRLLELPTVRVSVRTAVS